MSTLCLASAHAELKHFLPTTNAYISILDDKFWFEGDTIIDNKEYIKVYRQFCHSETECNENKDYYAAVRQDTINEKIYCIQVDDGVERLIADFDVKAGDEVSIYSFWSSDLLPKSFRILDVDAIMIDGQYRKRVSIKSEYSIDPVPGDFWVEGIGSIVYGLFYPCEELVPNVVDLDIPKFMCLHVNNELIYQSPDVNTCYREHYCEGYLCCVYGCERLGGVRNDCEFYCDIPSFFDEEEYEKFNAFRHCITNCTNEGGEFGDCLSHCLGEYLRNIPENSYKAFNISLSPTKDYLFVETELFSCSYMIYNTLGAVVKQGNLSNSEINISTLSQGVYYIVFYHNKELIYIHKFVK